MIILQGIKLMGACQPVGISKAVISLINDISNKQVRIKFNRGMCLNLCA